ncbi:MAG TPA: cupredoxin domain-containing protein [Verrucomicrobiae bacterium]|nr:cupredoxin domain-containing protein [Verrucomicrobiae bacterium]
MASSLLLFVILIGLVSYAVFKKSPDTSTNPANITTVQAPAAIAPAIVSITNTGFVPATVSIKIGQAVAWTNTDSSPHSVTSDDPRPMAGIPDPDSQTAISQNNTYDYVFDKAGIYSYHDDNNLAFRATVVVK